ncbi:MAG: ribosome biogenesis GTPase YlqF [Oscillospiraceae bacterium]|nr:ribosome biogenesis GTPase YlqF [Oscillospiraceae bacterium]
MNEEITIQWFPGHMTKTKRMMQKYLPMVDAVVEIIDARAPQSSRNPDIAELIGGKPDILIMNKCDAADPVATDKWMSYFRKSTSAVIAADCRTGRGLDKFDPTVREVLSELIASYEAKGMGGRMLHLMVVGIPNVGKSSFINRMAGTRKARVEDRPGVTRDKQWVQIGDGLELLDMPGVLWPKFEDMTVGERLAFTGAVKDTVLDTELLACRLLLLLRESYAEGLTSCYGIDLATPEEDEMMASEETLGCASGYELLCRIGKRRGMLIRGGDIDTERAAISVLDGFRSGKLGRITLELPPI